MRIKHLSILLIGVAVLLSSCREKQVPSGSAVPYVAKVLGDPSLPGHKALMAADGDDVSGAIALMEAGNLKMAACIDTKRDPAYPDIATAREMGFDLVNTSFWGICAPKDTPDAVVDTLHEAFKAALEAPSTTSANSLRKQLVVAANSTSSLRLRYAA